MVPQSSVKLWKVYNTVKQFPQFEVSLWIDCGSFCGLLNYLIIIIKQFNSRFCHPCLMRAYFNMRARSTD